MNQPHGSGFGFIPQNVGNSMGGTISAPTIQQAQQQVPSPQPLQPNMQTNAFVQQMQASNEGNLRILTAFAAQYINLEFMENIVNTMMYNIDTERALLSGRSNDSIQGIKSFLNDCNKDLELLKNSNHTIPVDLLRNAIRFTRQVLELRSNTGNRLITYDNLDEHFMNVNDIQIKKIIQNVKNNRLKTVEEFRTNFETIEQTIVLSDELRGIRDSILGIENLLSEARSGDMPLMTLAAEYKKVISECYTDVSNLRVLNKVSELSDYMVIGGDQGATEIANDITSYLSEGYTFFKSGYKLIDDSIGGIESANVHIICGPSNNAKSIFMINLAWQMMLNNVSLFKDGDTFLFYTLEDDIYKLIRRFISIFGNVGTGPVKELFIKGSTLMKKHDNKDIKNTQDFKDVSKLFQGLLEESVFKACGKRLKFILKHAREAVSPGDMVKFIDARRCEGLNVRAVFIDYIDIMVPTSSRMSDGGEYYAQGVITQELRNLAAEYSVPVITITQATRSAETDATMGNHSMADSHKKVRYSDYIYMIRMRYDMDVLAECVKEHVIPLESHTQVSFTDMSNPNNSNLRPFEIKITKAKDGAKNDLRYHIFSGNNLRIYEELNVVHGNYLELEQNSQALANQIELLGVSDVRSAQVQNTDLLL